MYRKRPITGFLFEYLPNSLEHIIYLDSDVFCINNPQFHD